MKSYLRAFLSTMISIGLILNISTGISIAKEKKADGSTIFLPVIMGTYTPSEKVLIPAGEFEMGCDPANNGISGCEESELPLHIVYLDAYQIDKYEVTNAQYALCVEAGACSAPSSNSSYSRSFYFGNPEFANYPVILVSWYDADNYCTWSGGYLPSEAEWEKAARGTTARAYPWDYAHPTCAAANFYYTMGSIYKLCVGDTSEVGSYPGSASPYGALDMAGNVYEWVSDWYDSGYYDTSPYANPHGLVDGIYKVKRGGSWGYFFHNLRTAFRAASYLDPNNNVGFRCAAP